MSDKKKEEVSEELLELLKTDAFGLRTYRCNAPPVEPFALNAEDDNHKVLAEVFACGTWRIDSMKERRSVNHDKVVEHVAQYGKNSLYATAKCPHSGLTAVHACAINGYLGLLKVLVDKAEASPLAVAPGLAPMMSSRLERSRGADVMWMAKRRGHKHIVDWLKTLPLVKHATASVEKQLVVIKDVHRRLLEEARVRLGEEAAQREVEEEARQAMEKKKKEKEKVQRKFREEINTFDGRMRAKKKALNDPEYGFKVSGTGRAQALEMLEDEAQTHRQERNRCKQMRSMAEDHEIGGEMKKPEQLILELEEVLDHYTQLWTLDGEFDDFVDEAKQTAWGDLAPEELEENCKKLYQRVKKLPKATKASGAFLALDKKAKAFASSCPLITSLHTPAMKKRHWDEVLLDCSKVEGADPKIRHMKTPVDDPQIQLAAVLNLKMHEPKVALIVEELTDKAVKESKQEDQLRQLESNWSTIIFLMNAYDKSPDVPLLKMDEKDFEQLESDLLTLQSMVSSRYDFFKAQSSAWQVELQNVGEVVAILAELQRMWSYLEPLFVGSDEVKRELPETAAKFGAIDAEVRALLKEAWATQNVKTACNKPRLIPTLEDLATRQDLCKKALNEFLDAKRMQFARFYFVSEADLLDILSNGSNPAAIMKHVDKVMLSTSGLDLTTNEKEASERPTAIQWVSGVGKEYCEFKPPVKLEGKVEIYLQVVLDAQCGTLVKQSKASLARYVKQDRIAWLRDSQPTRAGPVNASDAAQVGLLIAAVYYTKECEAAMAESAKQNGSVEPIQRFLEHTVTQLNALIVLTKTDLDKSTSTRVMTMITYDAHSRDMVEKAIRQQAYQATSFQWQSQLKMRYDAEEDRWLVHILNAEFDYGFEYLGNGPRLVVTPLTDRVYVTATQALNLCMGCAPAGPAGTGKTESTKDLAAALGKCCYVFNCSPEMDYKSLGNIFKGLACSGSWGCFDEFNRLIPEVLSVCTVQFKAVCNAVRKVRDAKAHAKKAGEAFDASTKMTLIEGDVIRLDETCGAFITMNPGYLGRSELPEGLKALFRPMTVMVPDLVLICENMLMAQGFVTSKSLASKFYSLYSLLAALLSKQDHYDWGLRAIKSVLVVAGMLLRDDPDSDEDSILMRALRDFNIAKIVQVDEVVFFGLLNDLFPGLDPPRQIDASLETSVDAAIAASGQFGDDVMRLKCVQLDELLAIRHCVFVMGPPGAFKTTCWKLLAQAKAIKDPSLSVKVVDINPKTMPTQDLYGYINMVTRDWKDGLLSTIMRDLGQIPDEKPKWILLDGDLDANWIESMNSVMDDNRMLTLASNERIPLKPHMRMIFEIRDLKYATPATVSRAGILYISTDDGFQWKSLVNTWVASRSYGDEVKAWLTQCFDEYVATALRSFRKMVSSIPQQETTLVCNLLNLLDALFAKTPAMLESAKSIEMLFAFAAAWAIGSSLGVADDGKDYRKIFSEWWKKAFRKVAYPAKETIFDFWLDPDTMLFESWDKSPAFSKVDFDSKTQSMSDLTVPTAESASVSFFMAMLVSDHRHVMLSGPSGTGKTAIIEGQLKKLDSETMLSQTINMNFYSSGLVLQTALEVPLQKKTGSLYGPPGVCHMVYFVDDINLPELDNYNTQSAIALIRQHVDYTHWYDISKLTLKTVEKCQYVTSMNPTAGSFQINPRLQRHFMNFAISMPNDASLSQIYQTFMNGHLESAYGSAANKAEMLGMTAKLLKATLVVHKEVAQTFRKTATNFHYEFNIRHVGNVFQGLLMSSPLKLKTPESVATCWVHECYRVYGDRLVSPEDLMKFEGMMAAQSKKSYSEYNFAPYFSKGEGSRPLIFAHFMGGVGEEPIYEQMTEMEDLAKILENALEEYNESNAVMDLVLFEDALAHICRITRIVNNARGHALLVGVGGSGKKSLTRLSGFICNYQTVMIQVSATYGIGDLKEDLKAMYNKAGVKGEGVLFLFTDAEITNEKFLVFINDLLGSADIAELYAQDEKDTVINACMKKAKAAGVSGEPAAVYEFFLSEVRKFLHVVLCFSPVGEDFRMRCRKFPALVGNSVIDWFQPWPEQALYSVGKKFLAQIEDLGGDAVRAQIETFMPFSFSSTNDAAKAYFEMEGRFVYTTPKSYLELLKLFSKILASKRLENDVATARLKNGVQKLEDCTSVVDVLKSAIAVDVQDANQKKKVAEGIAKRVKAEKEVVEMESENAAIEEKKVTKIAGEVGAKQMSAEADLAKAVPAVEAAMAALDTLDVKALQMCKTMTKPPPGVDDVFSACMVLLAGVTATIPIQKNGKVKDKDRSWDSSKKFMLGDPKKFVDDLKSYKDVFDAGRVPVVNWKEVRMYLEMEHFQPEIIMSKNSAAAGLCNWVVNIVMYYDVVSMVEPKKKLVAESKIQLEEANTKLGKVRARVKELEDKLGGLINELNEAEGVKQAAEATVARGELKLSLAERLLGALSSENVRWNAGIARLQQTRDLLVGDTLLSASFISYIGPFTKQYRTKLLEDQWLPALRTPKSGSPVPMSKEADPLTALTNESEVASWQTMKLPADPVSTENGAIVSRSTRWPLLIDPQLQGVAWIKTQYSSDKDKMLRVARLGTKDLIRVLTECLQGGLPMLIENMGEAMEASIMPAVQRLKMKRGARFFLKLGEDEVEYHNDFRMFLHTKLSNPHYPPEVQAECTLVNFTVTPAGLEDQLLALVVSKERPDLASQKVQLIQQQNQFKIKMIQIEDEILARLAAAQGDITEDRDLIEGLEAAKRTANDIEGKLAAGRKTTESINNTSEKFRAAARRGSQLFFIMNDLVKIHTYYIYSLNAFVVVFLNGIDVVQRETTASGPAKGFGISSFKKIAKRVIAGIERFPWNRDILMRASHTDTLDVEFLDKVMSAGTSPKAPSATTFNVGEQVECDLAVGKILKVLDVHGRPALVVEVVSSDGGAARRLVVPQSMCEKYIDYAARNRKLIETTTAVCFNYVRRGLFERDKLTVVSLFICTLQIADGLLPAKYLDMLLLNRGAAGDAPSHAVLAFLPEAVWPKLRALQQDAPEVPLFATILENVEARPAEWDAWYNSPAPERADCPCGEGAVHLGLFEKILLLSAMRTDRVTMGVTAYIREVYGELYVEQQPFDMKRTYMETTASTPVFFVLFPGVDPTTWVEQLGESFGITVANRKFVNISMGQGQEAPAEAMLEQMAKEGGWVMLQNLHLMQNWLPVLERRLEVCSEHAHADFRCFISAEPPSFAYQRNIPESLMQSCIKVSNEAPSDIKSNVERAWKPFDQTRLEACSLPVEFRACLFGLCFFHGVMLGRKRFGQQGWSRKYGFNMGDLTICADVLQAYLDDKGQVPWEDLRYIFGEIMYGGHITDFWDRRTNNTYLQVSFTPELLQQGVLGFGFHSPDAKTHTHRDMYVRHLKDKLPPESPLIYGLHMNSEIAYLNSATTALVSTILRLKAGTKAGGGGGGGGTEEMIDALLVRLPQQFDLYESTEKAAPLLKGKDAPYLVVVLQELGRMNDLTAEIARSLEELKKGLLGQLNMSQKMEDLLSALSIRQVPGRNPFHTASWEVFAWPSMKGLPSWFEDVILRCAQLSRWADADNLRAPLALWLPGLFNPTAFLTAIKQVTARNQALPLDKMTTETHISSVLSPDDLTEALPEGAFVHGLFCEGACWGKQDDEATAYMCDAVACTGVLQDSKPKELLPALPLMYIKAVQVQPTWDPSSVGYLRPEEDLYNCPVYLTTFRGPTFVFVATLKTQHAASHWVLRGVAIVSQLDD